MKILVVGSVAYDTVETPEGKRESQLGGSAVYFSTAASYFAEVGIIGVVGGDFKDSDRKLLTGHGIDISGLETASGDTFRWSGHYKDDLNNPETLETQLNVFADFDPRLEGAHARAPVLFLANIDPKLQRSVLASMAARPALVACDTMNLWIDIARPQLSQLFSQVDTLLINEAEARQFTQEQHLPTAAAALLETGLNSLVIKRGEYGVAMFHNEFNFAAPAFPLATVVDPTGAGDSFAGGFIGYLAAVGQTDEESLRRAAVVGSTMASFAVESFGLDRLQGLTHFEIEGRYNDFVDLTRFLPIGETESLPRAGNRT